MVLASWVPRCWTYYTSETPPLFAVLAHGMASVAFWRSSRVLVLMSRKLPPLRKRQSSLLEGG